MSSKEQTYTSTGGKLIHHTDTVAHVKTAKKGTPVSLQIAPTSRCNLNCSFCSNVNRDKHEDLNYNKLEKLLISLQGFGLKTVEWTGGGEPLLYKPLSYVSHLASMMGYRQGLITNGLLLEDMLVVMKKRFDWVRVSMNCLDYRENVIIPTDLQGTLGFSYVMNNNTTNDILQNLHDHVQMYKPEYVRIVPNCQTSVEEQERNNKILSAKVEAWGEPYFYQAKHFSRPERCWWCYFKPFVLHDGYVYPCSSVVLNDEAERQFHEKYRWCAIEELPDKYVDKMTPFDTSNCSHCVFRRQNDMVEELMCPTGHEDFL